MRVVIVGGAGFLGCAVAARLAREGCTVRVLDTPERLEHCAQALARIETGAFDFATDASPARLLDGADALIHLGCTTNPAQSMRDMAHDAQTNIAPSLKLFRAAADSGVRRVVFASSGGTVYGAPRRLPVVETDPTVPLSAYGVSKLAIEGYLGLFEQIEGVSLRVANPYGSFQLRGTAIGVIASCVRSVFEGNAIEVWGDGSIVRDYIAIEDVAEAFARAVVAPGPLSGRFNVGSGVGTSITAIIELVFAAAGRQVAVDYLPGRAYDVPAIVLDSRLFADWTGWTPGISLQAGIDRLWNHAVSEPAVSLHAIASHSAAHHPD